MQGNIIPLSPILAFPHFKIPKGALKQQLRGTVKTDVLNNITFCSMPHKVNIEVEVQITIQLVWAYIFDSGKLCTDTLVIIGRENLKSLAMMGLF